jgi:restriction system protein
VSKKITVSIPVAIQDKVEMSSIYENQTQTGKFSSYGVDLTLKELRQFRKLKSSDLDVLQCKIESTLESWAKAYERGEKSGNVDQMNQDIAEHLEALNNILKHTLDINDAVNWDSIKRNEPFRIAPQDIIAGLKKAPEQIRFAADGKPMGFIKIEPGPRPMLEQVTASYGLFTRMFNKQKIQTDYEQRQVKWRKECGEVNAENERRQTLLTSLKKSFEGKREVFEKEKAADNAAIDAVRQRYQTGDPSAIEEYCDLVLMASSYPDDFPRNWELEYRPANRMLVVQMDLPAPGDMPEVENYKYVKSRDTIEAKKMPESARKSLYDSVIYQTCLRTVESSSKCTTEARG